uniref:Uncharacterized protein n=1 Tax=Periophthalmus magnuspinnatus TaxID=409849 RepID=A0A3B4AEM1_9GOBI
MCDYVEEKLTIILFLHVLALCWLVELLRGWRLWRRCRPSPASPDSDPHHSGPPRPEHSSAPLGFHGDRPELSGFGSCPDWTEAWSGLVSCAVRLPSSDC